MSITKICSCGYVGCADLHDKKGTDVVCEYFAKNIEAEATKPKSAAECVVGPCDCDPHIETCDQCAPYLYATKPQEPITVTCQIYGHVVGVCDECNTHAEKDVHDTNKILADNYLKMTCGEPQPCPLCNSAELEAELLNKEGMTCGDCNDTGWLENREDGRYPCTCMTEAEPYQLLGAERDALKVGEETWSEYSTNLVNELTKTQKERDALAMQNQELVDAAKNLMTWQVKNVHVWHNSAYDNMESVIEKSNLFDEVFKRRDADKKDAERYRWLRPNLLAADFDWNESGESAIVFKWPRSVPVGADCDKNIDAAIDAEIGAQL